MCAQLLALASVSATEAEQKIKKETLDSLARNEPLKPPPSQSILILRRLFLNRLFLLHTLRSKDQGRPRLPKCRTLAVKKEVDIREKVTVPA